MTICIDCRMIAASGIGAYLKGCLPYFFKSANRFLLLSNSGPEEFSRTASGDTTIIDCGTKPFSLRELLFFPRNILHIINACDAFYSPYFNIPCGIKIPVYTTIHDIIFPDMPELVSKTGLAMRMFFYRRAYKKSQKIFTVSEFSKSRIEHHLGNTKPVIVTHESIQDEFLAYRQKIPVLQKKNTIIFIGNIKKHKGLNCLLDAFLLAKKEGLSYKLIIIGAKENFRSSDTAILQKIEAIGSDSVSIAGFISDEHLMEYLSEASLLVQPSLYEGFGRPPLEAMSLGTLALVSDIPVFREIYDGFPVVFFHPGDTNDLKNKMLENLCNTTPGAVNLPEYLLYKYTFEKTASIILQNLHSEQKEKE